MRLWLGVIFFVPYLEANTRPFLTVDTINYASDLLEAHSSIDGLEVENLQQSLNDLVLYETGQIPSEDRLRKARAVLWKAIRTIGDSSIVLKRALVKIAAAYPVNSDEHLFLEEIEGEMSQAWVAINSGASRQGLSQHQMHKTIRDRLLHLYQSDDRVAVGHFSVDGKISNLWTDAKNVRGVYRVSDFESYIAGQPQWENILDFDALNQQEGKNWVYKGASSLFESSRVLISLSDGGLDAVEVREFDTKRKDFVKNGFFLEPGKHRVSWINEDLVLLARALVSNPNEQTTSGYPRTIRLWKRGQLSDEAEIVFEGNKDDVSVSSMVVKNEDETQVFFVQSSSFYDSSYYLWKNGLTHKINVPSNCYFVPVGNRYSNHPKGLVLIKLNDDWNINNQTFNAGSLIRAKMGEFDIEEPSIELIRQPRENESIENFSMTQNYLLVTTMEDIASHVYRYDLNQRDNPFVEAELPDFASSSIYSIKPGSDLALGTYESFLEPTTYFLYDVESNEISRYQKSPSRFEASQYEVEQKFATSLDGTRVPYFVVGLKGIERPTPLLQYGYGGFRVSLSPYYLSAVESAWLREGHRYVIANIRGGGEYGPSWHKAALKEKRYLAFQDFIAISEDLIENGYTTRKQLAIEGGSNGGLLTGTVMTMRPDLYGAVVISVPLLDMMRYTDLLAGSSWIAEYGNPDIPSERAFLELYSPYHNLDPSTNYPVPYIYTSMKDDRVHPGHARKMAHLLEDYGMPFFYIENQQGGHGATDLLQRADNASLKWAYLYMSLVENLF